MEGTKPKPRGDCSLAGMTKLEQEVQSVMCVTMANNLI